MGCKDLAKVLGALELPLPLFKELFMVCLDEFLGAEVEGWVGLFGGKILLNSSFLFSSGMVSTTETLLLKLYVFDSLRGECLPQGIIGYTGLHPLK